ncbi:E3 ubiquitin/ISG15 ligase TRIM25 isoform X8 [Misgurnus anguillicaudatus]|uniref:E3 ubiquitin/ISG15 ligase TRIM25 isoform X8 n=1 Tax=Misgurnus anguillicaudatus TaxID=75329 RepID=UPI003CCF570B
MAEKMSLLSLEDDLTCSICLCVFDNPVSLICGHSFCANCLEAAWSDRSSTLFCPHCRMQFNSKPELRKNTVLGAVLDAYKGNSGISESEPMKTPVEVIKNEPEPIKCDSCMEAPAVKTCLTCMASYCEDHVRPHRENAIFRAHQLSDPLPDLLERLCPEHSKLMEFFCSKHGTCICSNCLHFGHKGCEFTSTDDQRFKQKTNLNGMLNTLEVKIDKNQQVVTQMKEQQDKLKGLAATRKHILETEYRQIRQMIDRDENEAMHAIDEELMKGQSKLASLMKKFNENVEKMSSTKSEINSLLDQSQSLTFLKARVDLPSVVNFEPYNPRINVDSKKVISYHSSAVALKEWIARLLEQPAENRILVLKPDFERTVLSTAQFSENRESSTTLPNPREMYKSRGTKEKNDKQRKDQSANITDQFPGGSTAAQSWVQRNELLKYGTILSFDVRTAHKRIVLSENFTKASVTDEPTHYPDIPTRFSVCSQVLCTKGFSQGRHYWEIKMSSNNFCGLGLAYGRIDRKGPSSRLGRNVESWCVEWFNVKLSAWHNSIETVLANPNPSRVGILLDCDGGSATFYNVQDRAYPFHTFVFPFSEPVYPAFWIFSNGSNVSLCKLIN